MSLRYLQSSNKNSTMKTMIAICFTGIATATFALALIISITQGFEQATYIKMQSIYPAIIIDANGQEIDYQQLQTVLNDPQYEIAHHAPETVCQALCNAIESQEMPYIIALKGIDPAKEQLVTPLQTMLLPKNQPHFLEKLLHDNQVIIGKQLALQMHLSTGSQLTLLYSTDENITKKNDFDQTTVIVSGIFDTGIEDFDANFIYCSITFFQNIFPDKGITQIYAQPSAMANETTVITKLQDRLKMNVYSWKKLYTALVSAMELEKYALFLILLLIILIACSNIISLLFMQITQKRKDIAILLTLGLTIKKIRNIFLALTMIIASMAASTGLLIAYLAAIFLQNYRWIQLPDNIYYTTYLPVLIRFDMFLFIFLLVLFISFIASLIPLYNIQKINIATILKNES